MRYFRLFVNWTAYLTAPLWLGFYVWFCLAVAIFSRDSDVKAPFKFGSKFFWE